MLFCLKWVLYSDTAQSLWCCFVSEPATVRLSLPWRKRQGDTNTNTIMKNETPQMTASPITTLQDRPLVAQYNLPTCRRYHATGVLRRTPQSFHKQQITAATAVVVSHKAPQALKLVWWAVQLSMRVFSALHKYFVQKVLTYNVSPVETHVLKSAVELETKALAGDCSNASTVKAANINEPRIIVSPQETDATTFSPLKAESCTRGRFCTAD